MPSIASMLNFKNLHKGNNMNEIVVEALREQIANPATATMNSQSAWVCDNIREVAGSELAREYWSWACMDAKTRKPIFGDIALALQADLDGITQANLIRMPSWGTYGT